MSEISLRAVREPAIQFLYALSLDGSGAAGATADHPFWETLLEKELGKLEQARATAALFQCQGHAIQVEKLKERSGAVADCLAALENSEPLRSAVVRMQEFEVLLEDRLDALKSAVRRRKKEPQTELSGPMEDLFATAADLKPLHSRISSEAADFPSCRAVFEPLLATVKKLAVFVQRLESVKKPERFPEDTAVRHLANEQQRLDKLRSEASRITADTLRQKERIDSLLSSVIENFEAGRLMAVDRAILRLACWEMLTTETPGAVIINETVSIARRLSTSKSASFVNGVLDAALNAARPETE